MITFENLFRRFISKSYNDIDMALKNSANVKKLDLQFINDLDNYATDFLKFVNLKELFIHTYINIKTLPVEIGQLTTLKKLGILNTTFDDFPEWITNLVNLEYLMVRGCEFTSVPKTIANLKKLKVLRIENCELAEMPEGINELTSLKELSFAITPILFSSLGNFPKNLKKLDLTANRNMENITFSYNNLYDLFPHIKISPHITKEEEEEFRKSFIQESKNNEKL